MIRPLSVTILSLMLCGVVVFAVESPADSAGKVSRAAATQPATTRPVNARRAATRPVASNKICPVDRNNPINPDLATVDYKGREIGFCCDDCIVKFLSDPEKYADGIE